MTRGGPPVCKESRAWRSSLTAEKDAGSEAKVSAGGCKCRIREGDPNETGRGTSGSFSTPGLGVCHRAKANLGDPQSPNDRGSPTVKRVPARGRSRKRETGGFRGLLTNPANLFRRQPDSRSLLGGERPGRGSRTEKNKNPSLCAGENDQGREDIREVE